MGSTDEPNRFQHTRVLGVDDVVANTGEGGVAAMGRTAGWGCCGGEMVKEEFVTESSPFWRPGNSLTSNWPPKKFTAQS
jgi:hypothetical protein